MEASRVLRAPAKLNLTLEVLRRRPDGLHALRSVMAPVDLCDELSFEDADAFTFVCDVPELRRNNLVERAIHALAVQHQPLRITLRKRIPTGGGMGGGSSDAAAILLAAQRGLFGVLPQPDYLRLARSLGSDVPFFLVETAALVEGAGERVTALGPVPLWHAIVVQPPVAVPTSWAYERIEARPRESRPRDRSASLQVAEALQRADFDAVNAGMQNDFQDALIAEVPEIAAAAKLLRDAGAPRAMLTGSGSCVFALTQNAEGCRAIIERIESPPPYRVLTCRLRHGAAWRSTA